MAIKRPEWITDKMWSKMCDCSMSLPIPLSEADTSKPFVYDRKFGFFYVSRSQHQRAMSLLLAWHRGMGCGLEVANKLNLSYPFGSADFYLERIDGTAFLSSISKEIYAWTSSQLNNEEKSWLGDVGYLCPRIYKP